MAPRTMVVAMLVMAFVKVKASSFSIEQNCTFNQVPTVALDPSTLDGTRSLLYYTSVHQSPPDVVLTTLTYAYDPTDQEIDVTKTLFFDGGSCQTSDFTMNATQAASIGRLFFQKTIPGGVVLAVHLYSLFADNYWWLLYSEVYVDGAMDDPSSRSIRLYSTNRTLTLANIPSGVTQALKGFCGDAAEPGTVLQYTTENLSAVCSK